MVRHVVFGRFGLAQPHKCSSKAATCHATVVRSVQAAPTTSIICTKDVTAVRRTLQRLQCVLETRLHLPRGAALRTSANGLLFLILRLQRRYAATTAVTAATLSSMAVCNLREVCVSRQIWNFVSVRPGYGFAHNTQRRAAAVGRHITLCTYLQSGRGTARGLQPFRVCTTTRMQLEGCNVSRKQYYGASGLQRSASNNMYRGRSCCTKHVAKATGNMFSRHGCMFLVEQL